MKTKDLIEMGFRNLWRRKLRTFLTILGVLIGTSSIVVMLSLGFGMSEAFRSQVESLGSLTTITVSKGYGGGGMVMSSGMGMAMEYGSSGGNKDAKLDDKAVNEFKQIPHVVATLPQKQTNGTIIAGKYITNIPIIGVSPESMDQFEFKVSEGRLLEPGDGMSFLFGGGAVNSFYDPKSSNYREPNIDLMNDKLVFTFDNNYGYNQMDQTVKYKEYKIKAVGILEPGDMDNDWAVFMPLDSLDKLLKEKARINKEKTDKNAKQYDSVKVKVEDIKYVKEIQDSIKAMGFEAYSLNEILDEMNKTSGTIQAILGGIGAVSLLVAAIGITNTMIMSIYERTREIGIMKVIGAALKDIKRLFLLESAIIGFFGGIFGVMFSYLISTAINKVAPGVFGGEMGAKISIIPLWLSLIAIGFSTLIGIMSGYYPAKRAMNLSALEAIQNE